MKSEIRIEHEHTLAPDDLIRKIENLALDMQSNYHFEYEHLEDPQDEFSRGLVLAFKSRTGLTKGVEGALHLGRSRVLIVLKLPFALRPMAAKIESEIQEYMTRNLQ